MNILTTNGFVGRFITDWSGPETILKSVSIRLGAPNYPYDTMRMTGRVIEKEDGVVTVEVAGRNSLGDHVTGTVKLTLPLPLPPNDVIVIHDTLLLASQGQVLALAPGFAVTPTESDPPLLPKFSLLAPKA